MVFTPVFYTAKEADAAKIVIYFIYFSVFIFLGGFLFEHFAALTHYVYTDALLTPANIPYYAIMPGALQTETKRYGIHYFIINSTYLLALITASMFLFTVINLRRRTIYILTLIISFVLGTAQTIKTIYYGLAYLNCVSFWFCRSRDVLAVPGTPSFQFTLMLFANLGYFVVYLVLFILIYALDKIMPLIVKEEADRGAVPINQSAHDSTLHIGDDDTMVVHALNQMMHTNDNDKSHITDLDSQGNTTTKRRILQQTVSHNQSDDNSGFSKLQIFSVDK